MLWWTEFKTTILPWLLAAAVIGLVIVESHRTMAQMMAINQTLTAALQTQGEALDGIQRLIGQQGYTVSPFVPDSSRSAE